MYKKIFIVFILLAVFADAQILQQKVLNAAKRGDGKFYAWIYFKDKDRSMQKVKLFPNAKKRRAKVGAIQNEDWYDRNLSENYIKNVLETGVKLRQRSRWLNAI